MLNFRNNNLASETEPENLRAQIFDLRLCAVGAAAQRRNFEAHPLTSAQKTYLLFVWRQFIKQRIKENKYAYRIHQDKPTRVIWQ